MKSDNALILLCALQTREVFSHTAVDEETLQKAKDRRSIFQTEEWGAVSQYSPGMQEIIRQKAAEQ